MSRETRGQFNPERQFTDTVVKTRVLDRAREIIAGESFLRNIKMVASRRRKLIRDIIHEVELMRDMRYEEAAKLSTHLSAWKYLRLIDDVDSVLPPTEIDAAAETLLKQIYLHLIIAEKPPDPEE